MLHGMAFSEDYIILQTLICIYCAGQTDERLVVRRLVLVGLCRDLCLLVTSAALLFAQIFYFILKVLCQTDIPSPELRACIAVVDSERTQDWGLGTAVVWLVSPCAPARNNVSRLNVYYVYSHYLLVSINCGPIGSSARESFFSEHNSDNTKNP